MKSVRLIERLYQCFNEEDWSSFKELCHETIEWRQNDGFPGGAHHFGAESIIANVFQKFAEEWEQFRFEKEEVIVSASGTRVIVLGNYTGNYKNSIKPLKAAVAHVFDIDSGRVRMFRQYADTAQIISAMQPATES